MSPLSHRALRTLAKRLLPPICLDGLRRLRPPPGLNKPDAHGWFGDYASWEAAVQDSGGYDRDGVIEKVHQSARALLAGQAAFDRDSVLFQKADYQWPLLACLMTAAAAHGGRLSLVDFGGALGSTYFQNRAFLTRLKRVEWWIVEQPKFVRLGRAEFESETLHFRDTIEDCRVRGEAQVLLLSGVLQYLQWPHEFMRQIQAHGFAHVIVDRTGFVEGMRDRLTVQRVPPEIYPASYPCWFFAETAFLDHWNRDYEMVADFAALDSANIPSRFKGYLFCRRTSARGAPPGGRSVAGVM